MKQTEFLLITITTLLISTGFGQDLTARDIIEKNDRQLKSQDEMSEFIMKLINKRGNERKRQVLFYSKTDNQNNDRTLTRFQAPADVKGVGLLSIENGEQENQWLYLPAMKRIRRISSSDKSDSFMGSDFTYEDIEQNDLNDYEYSLLHEEEIDGIDCYLIQSVPIDEQVKKETAYSRTETWIRKDNFFAIKVNFYNRKGDLMKIMNAGDIRPVESTEKWRAYLITMENVKIGHRTELIYKDIQINQGVEDKYFTHRFLERGR